MNLDGIFDWILKHPLNYPGKHQQSQPRINSAYKPLEPKAQFHIIFKATSEYIKNKMHDGKGVNMKGFGAFTFEVYSDFVKPYQLSGFDISKDLNEQREQRKHVHKIRPCFIPDAKLKYSLSRYPGKEEISAPQSQHSIYQKGFGMMFCNSGPIAASCLLGKEVVASAHAAFIAAICDLTSLGHSMYVDFGFVQLRIQNKNLSYKYLVNFSSVLNEKSFEYKMRRSDMPTPDHWLQTYEDKWAQSSLNTLLKRPNTEKVQEHYEKSLALKIMSLDLSTAEKTNYSVKKGGNLPAINGAKK